MDASRHEEILRCLFRESNDAFFLFDPRDLSVVDLNPAALRLTGFDRRAALGLRVTELFGSSDPRGLESLIEAYRKTGVFHSREDYTLRRADGPPIAVNLSASRIHTTPEPLGLVVARDIGERRKALDVLDRFFGLSPALFGILSPDGRLRKSNRAWEQVLGYSADELRSAEVLSLVHPDDRHAAAPAFGGAEGELSGREIRCRHKDGSDRWLSWSSVRTDGGSYVVALDVTAAKEATALRQAKEAAEAANHAKGQFLSSVSHELRTPLTAILTLVDVLILDPASAGLPPARAEDLRTIKRNGEHLLQMINGTLDLAKIEAGKIGIEPVSCDPASIASEVVEIMRVRAEAKSLPLIVEHATPIPPLIRTDPVRLRQILINLVANAITSTESGSVRVRVGVDREPTGPPTLRFDVIDTGVGLRPEEIDWLFQPFHQIPDPRRRPPEGSGLGLAISRRLAEALSGRITVRSEPGRGSIFRLSLALDDPARSPQTPDEKAGVAAPAPSDAGTSAPAADTETTRPGPARRIEADREGASSVGTASPPERRSGRVLLAEDNADNRRAMTLRLQLAGLEVTGARDGQEALDYCANGPAFDVILMDMQMPVMDGYEATRRLRNGGYRGLIVALTAYAMEEDRAECLRYGCDHHLGKPVDWSQLFSIIGEARRESVDGKHPIVA